MKHNNNKTRIKQGLEKRIWEKTKKTRVKQGLCCLRFKLFSDVW